MSTAESMASESMANKAAASETAKKRSALDLLLGDHPYDEFFSEFWEKRTAHIVHNDPGRFKHIMSSKRFVEEEAMHCRNLRAVFRDERGWPKEMGITGDQVAGMHQMGHSICATMLREEGSVKEFLDSVRKDIYSAAGPHLNVYYSPDKTGAGLHFDTHPVWLLQIEGSKDWIVGRKPAIKNPMFNINFPPDREVLHLPWVTIRRPDTSDENLFMKLTLHPGDVVYMPPGTWHHARARDGYSFAATLAQARVTGFEILLFCLMQKVAAVPEVAARVYGMPAYARGDNGELTDELEGMLDSCKGKLGEMVGNVTMDDLRAAYRHLSTVDTQQLQMVTPTDAARLMKNIA